MCAARRKTTLEEMPLLHRLGVLLVAALVVSALWIALVTPMHGDRSYLSVWTESLGPTIAGPAGVLFFGPWLIRRRRARQARRGVAGSVDRG